MQENSTSRLSEDVAAVEVEDLKFAWPGQRPVLAIDRLVLQPGERVFLTGASGSGKSTLLSLIGGVLSPSAGRIRILGNTMNEMPPSGRDRVRAEHVGFIFQMFNLIPYLTVRDNVLLPLKFTRLRRQRLNNTTPEREAHRLLTALGLAAPDLLDRPAMKLSIGQQQRVAAARALIGRPELLVADEPTSSLDADARADFLRLLMEECARHDTAILFVSHDRSLGTQFDRSVALADINRLPALPA